MERIVLTRGLTKCFGPVPVVDSLDIDVRAGDFFGFLGPNGAGKTTTLRMLCGLFPPTRGRVEVAGCDIVENRELIRNMIGMLPESMGFYGWMNAEEYLLHFAALYDIEPEEAKQRETNLIRQVGLADKASVPIAYYSRGMKQRLGLARALINSPKILLLDEPTLGLDPQGQKDIRKMLIDLNRKGITIVFSSHSLGDVATLCNRFAIINRGKLAALGTLQEIRHQAQLEETGGLIIEIRNHPDTLKILSHLPFTTASVSKDDDLLEITVRESGVPENQVIRQFIEAGLSVYEVRKTDTSLEDIFFALTRESLHGNTQIPMEGSVHV